MVYQWDLPRDLANKNGLYMDFYHAETYWWVRIPLLRPSVIKTDFLTERKLLVGSGGGLPQEIFWIFTP